MDISRDIKKYLLENSDSDYLKFNKKIVNDDSLSYYGVKIPIIRKLGKKLKKEYELDYMLDNIGDEYYEELILKGILIGEYKDLSLEKLEYYIDCYVPKISNWAICDTFCSGLKITNKYLDEMFLIIKKYLKSDLEFEVRFGLVMLLNYYLNDDYIDYIYDIINDIKLDYYYVKMANAWLLSYCLIKYYDKTILFLKTNNSLDTWTYNKGIQKGLESYRLTKKQKSILKSLKRKEVK